MFALNVPSKQGSTSSKTEELGTNDLFAALNSIPSTSKKTEKPFGGMGMFPSTLLAKESIVSVFDGLDVTNKSSTSSSPFGMASQAPSSAKEFVAAKKAQQQAVAELEANARAREEEKKRKKEALNPLMAQLVGGHKEDTKKMKGKKPLSRKERLRKEKAEERGASYASQMGYKAQRLTSRKERMKASKKVY